ncbi:MAG: PKD domain-containing protein [Gemmatimonadales bacterium]
MLHDRRATRAFRHRAARHHEVSDPGRRWSCTAARACTFNGTGSRDPDGSVTAYAWKMSNGSTVSTAASFTRTFPSARTFALTLTVTDNGGATSSTTQTITVP